MPDQAAFRILSFAVAIMITTLGAAGCAAQGEGRLSKREYLDRAQRVLDRGDAAMKSIRAGQAKSARQVFDQSNAAVEELDKAAADLKELQPPKDWQDEHDALVEGLEQTAANLRRIADAAQANNVKKLTAVMNEQSQTDAKIGDALNSMNNSR